MRVVHGLAAEIAVVHNSKCTRIADTSIAALLLDVMVEKPFMFLHGLDE